MSLCAFSVLLWQLRLIAGFSHGEEIGGMVFSYLFHGSLYRSSPLHLLLVHDDVRRTQVSMNKNVGCIVQVWQVKIG